VCGVIYKTASLSVGTNTSCLVTTAGGAKCWGYNVYGQVGDGTTIARSKPTDVTGLTTNASAIESGVYYHTCALTSTGGVKCWGYNGHGQLGDGTTTTKYIPTDVTGLSSGVTALAAGYQHTCALISDGTVKCWGYNGYGQLGDGTTTTKYVPTAVSSITSGATAVTCGYNFTCAIVNGGAKCWGYNSYGNLGDGTTKAQYVPTDVSGLATGVTWIDAGSYHACAIGAGAALSCWGQNTYGQLGDGTTVTKYVPTPVVALTSGISKVACGSNHTCALTSGGLVKCWGQNSYGQLGDNTTTSKSTPVDIVP
jgi:alpha-tubulin suppressor-like RCC1 family protein